MKITNIKQQVKRPDRFSIYVDGDYVLSFGESELLASGLYVGRELREGELDQLKDASAADKAYEKLLNYVSIRRRSEWEIREYLRRKDVPAELSVKLLNKLSKHNYLNDEIFARAWVESRRLLKTISKRRLSQELRAKRIKDDIITRVLSEDETNDIDQLRVIIAKKRRLPRYQDNLKLMQFLVRQGYNYDDIKTALHIDSED